MVGGKEFEVEGFRVCGLPRDEPEGATRSV